MTTKNTVQENLVVEHGLLSSEERAILNQIAAREAPFSQRAQAFLALDKGATQAEAGKLSGLAQGQVRYWLSKFRRDGMDIFPAELLNQDQSATQADTPDVLDIEQFQDEADVEIELVDMQETAVSVDEMIAQPESKAKKKTKKKAKQAKKTKKTKKTKKAKQAKKNKSSKKASAKKGKSGKKKRKNK